MKIVFIDYSVRVLEPHETVVLEQGWVQVLGPGLMDLVEAYPAWRVRAVEPSRPVRVH